MNEAGKLLKLAQDELHQLKFARQRTASSALQFTEELMRKASAGQLEKAEMLTYLSVMHDTLMDHAQMGYDLQRCKMLDSKIRGTCERIRKYQDVVRKESATPNDYDR